MSNGIALLQTARLPFVILTPVYIFLGVALSLAPEFRANDAALDLWSVSWILVAAMSAHISVNCLNEYVDFRSGLDFQTQKTPFSGGSGSLPKHPEMAKLVLLTGLLALAVTLISGSYIVFSLGFIGLPLGLLGVLLVLTYTPWLNRWPLLCLVSPGIGFGLLMVAGTFTVLTGSVKWPVLLISMIPFLLASNLLLLNQYPDAEADARVGRNHMIIAYGVTAGNCVLALSNFLIVVLLAGLIAADVLPVVSVCCLLPLAGALYALRGAIQYGTNIGSQPRYLASNILATLLTPLVLGISVLL